MNLCDSVLDLCDSVLDLCNSVFDICKHAVNLYAIQPHLKLFFRIYIEREFCNNRRAILLRCNS